MALRQGWGVCSWEAGIVMKPILRERRSEAMSRTRTPGPGPAPGPAGPAGATSLPELGREDPGGAEVRPQASGLGLLFLHPRRHQQPLWPLGQEEGSLGGNGGHLKV